MRPLAGTITLSGFTTGDGTYAAAGEFSSRWSSLHAGQILYVGTRSGTSEHVFSRLARKWRLL